MDTVGDIPGEHIQGGLGHVGVRVVRRLVPEFGTRKTVTENSGHGTHMTVKARFRPWRQSTSGKIFTTFSGDPFS